MGRPVRECENHVGENDKMIGVVLVLFGIGKTVLKKTFDKTIYSLIICSLKYDKKIQNALKKRPTT